MSLDRWNALKDWLSQDLGGGPRVLKAAWVIDVQKGGTLLFTLLLMALYGEWGATAWTYAALHGTYGICWLFKEAVFPDRNWQKRVTFGGAFLSWAAVLGPYWLMPWLTIARHVQAPPALLAVAVGLHTLGVVLMMGADGQKHFVLQVRRGLITDGFFARVRHPNYLGEMMIYASYALIASHWLPWVHLLTVWTLVFVPNMLAKERSMRRYPTWAAYEARTGMLLPKLFPPASAPEPEAR